MMRFSSFCFEKRLLLVTLSFLMSSASTSPIQDGHSRRQAIANEISTPERDAPNAILHRRERRNYTPSHNYAEVVYDNTYDLYGNPGHWLQDDCETIFNCEKISEHHCNQHGGEFYCSGNTVGEYCQIDFDVEIFNVEVYSAVDLALYKIKESNTPFNYKVYILLITDFAVHIASTRTISSQCSGWQVFHIQQKFYEIFKTGKNLVQFQIVVEKDKKFMSCRDVGGIFVMNATNSYVHEEASGSNFLDIFNFNYDETSMEDTNPETAQNNPFSIPDDRLINYIPVINLFFAFKRRKRSIDHFPMSRNYNADPKSLLDDDNGYCRRIEKIVNLDTVQINEEVFRVIKPEMFNIGECKLDNAKKNDPFFNSAKCVPRGFKSLDMLVVRENSKRDYSIRRKGDIVVEGCSLKSNKTK